MRSTLNEREAADETTDRHRLGVDDLQIEDRVGAVAATEDHLQRLVVIFLTTTIRPDDDDDDDDEQQDSGDGNDDHRDDAVGT